MVFVVLGMSIFLLAFVGFATDYTQLWYQRQAIQGAADATCQAAGMDLLLYAEGQATPNMNFTPSVGGNIDCASTSTAAPCIISVRNGYDGTVAGNQVAMSFPATVSGAPSPPAGVAVPYVQVDITRQAPVFFSRLLTGSSTSAVHAAATCGLTAPNGPVPIVVLHPTDPEAISMKGAKDAITIIGGPQRSIEVNSSNQPSSVNLSTIDLHKAGPNGTGGDFAVFGGPSAAPGSVNLGSTGHWDYPATPILDPYRQVSGPAKPAIVGVKSPAKKASQCGTPAAGCYKFNGCPDSGGCDEYTAGYYSSEIKVKNGTAIFDPGIYYVVGGLTLDSNSNVRVSTATGDSSGGVMFFLSGSSSLSVAANSGGGTTDAYHLDGSTSANGVPSRALQCPGGSANPSGLPATVNGNVLLGPCTGTYGDPTGQYRGFVFFQDRSAAASPSWQGGGSSLVSGFMYFHQCRSDGTGLNCSAPGSGGFGTTFNLGGNPGSGSYTVGSIVTDTIAMNGNPGITMILSPVNSFPQLKVIFLK